MARALQAQSITKTRFFKPFAEFFEECSGQDAVKYPAGHIHTLDLRTRAMGHFLRWFEWKRHGIYFPSRQKANMKPETLGAYPFDAESKLNAGVLRDELVGLPPSRPDFVALLPQTAPGHRKALRRSQKPVSVLFA